MFLQLLQLRRGQVADGSSALTERMQMVQPYPLAPCAVSLTCFLSSVFELEAATSEAKARARRRDSIDMTGGMKEVDADSADDAEDGGSTHAYKEQGFWELLLERGRMGFYEVFCIAFEMLERNWRVEMEALVAREATEEAKGAAQGEEGSGWGGDLADSADGGDSVVMFAMVLKRTKHELLQLLEDPATGASLADLAKAASPPLQSSSTRSETHGQAGNEATGTGLMREGGGGDGEGQRSANTAAASANANAMGVSAPALAMRSKMTSKMKTMAPVSDVGGVNESSRLE
jgi:hypothetical protein